MQDPNADTEWNDALRRHNIIPKKNEEKTITESDVQQIVDHVVAGKLDTNAKGLEDMTLEELELVEDEEDERAILEYRRQRLRELAEVTKKSNYGDVVEIRAEDYLQEVTKAGEGIWVVLHLYKQGIPLCSLINQFLSRLANKFPTTKFLRSISTNCIQNYPDRNLPTIFVYHEGKMKTQFVGTTSFGGLNLKIEDLEWMLAESGAVKSEMKENPRKKVKDVMFAALGHPGNANSKDEDSGDDND